MNTPGFESYNMMNFTPNVPMMYPYYNNNQCSLNNDNRITNLENEVNNLQARLSKLEGNMYPQAIDYNSYNRSYQNSML